MYEHYSEKYEKEMSLNEKKPVSPKKTKSFIENSREICEKIYIAHTVLEDRYVNFAISLKNLLILLKKGKSWVFAYAGSPILSVSATKLGDLQGTIL